MCMYILYVPYKIANKILLSPPVLLVNFFTFLHMFSQALCMPG